MEKLVESDGKGRLTLGTKYAYLRFIVEEKDGDLVLKKVVVVPEKELWLYQNPEAFRLVQEGLEQAKRGELHDYPLDFTE
ncbi:MAG: hypothetical protein AB7F31_01295 [Parachlamydiales bacterium]